GLTGLPASVRIGKRPNEGKKGPGHHPRAGLTRQARPGVDPDKTSVTGRPHPFPLPEPGALTAIPTRLPRRSGTPPTHRQRAFPPPAGPSGPDNLVFATSGGAAGLHPYSGGDHDVLG